MYRALSSGIFALSVSTAALAQTAPSAPANGGTQTPPAGTTPAEGPPAVPPPPEVPPPPSTTPEPVEPPEPGGERVAEPPPPGPLLFVAEPPPPPVPRHVAPRTSLWLGLRVGWFVPFGSLYADGALLDNGFIARQSVDIRDYVHSGPLFELDVGARIARNYTVFGFWERAELSAGRDITDGEQKGGSSDFYGAGVRASSNADHVGFLTELAVGYRRLRAEWDDGGAIEATHAFPEARFSVGADIRLTRAFALSPMVSFGVGGFGEVHYVDPNGKSTDLIGAYGSPDNHGWFELHLGGHFDVFGKD
jgi:hypothetical protein